MDSSESDSSDEEWMKDMVAAEEAAREDKRIEEMAAIAVASMADTEETPAAAVRQPRRLTTAQAEGNGGVRVLMRDALGNIIAMQPRSSPWFLTYVENPKTEQPAWCT